MSSHNNPIVVNNNEDEQRYEVQSGGYLAELVYERIGNQIIFLHTGVPLALEGRGIAGMLAHTALEDARSHHLTVIPQCPYVAAYIRRHHEYLPLLKPSDRERLLADA